MSNFFEDNTSEKLYVETHKGGKGRVRHHILKLLSFAMKCGCFGVDCCTGYMKVPATDDSEKVYVWIAGDVIVNGTKAEADAASLAGKAVRPKCDFC